MLFSNFPLLRQIVQILISILYRPKKINENYFQTTFQQSNKLATISQYIKFLNFALPSFQFPAKFSPISDRAQSTNFSAIFPNYKPTSLSFSLFLFLCFVRQKFANSKEGKIPETFRNKSSRGMSE